MMWWWVASGVIFLVVIPLVVVLATQLVRLAGEVHDYAHDILLRVGEVEHNLEPIPTLADTSSLLSSLRSPEGRLQELLEGNG